MYPINKTQKITETERVTGVAYIFSSSYHCIETPSILLSLSTSDNRKQTRIKPHAFLAGSVIVTLTQRSTSSCTVFGCKETQKTAMALSLTLVALLALPSFAASQLVTTGSYFRNVKASETGETDSLIEEAFFNCDREKTCSSVVKSKTRGDVKTTRENLTTDQMEAYEFAYAKDTVIFHLQSKSTVILL